MPANVVTAKGREIIGFRMKGTPSAATEPLNVGWGKGGVAGGPFVAAVTDVAPFQESTESRVAGTSSAVTTGTFVDTYQVVGTITSAGSQTIAEVLLSDSTTKPFSTTVASGTVIGSNSATGMTVAASYTPANNTYIQVRTEVMQVTAGSGSTALTVARGVNGSAAISTVAASDVVTTGNPPTGTGTSAQQATSNMFFHSDFTGLALSTGDSIQFTLQVQFV
jgi:hypothetical protein